MTSSAKRKGDRAELEVQALLRDNLGGHIRRALGAGRKDDIGDIDGLPGTVIQVVDQPSNTLRAIREKPHEAERQRHNLEQLVGQPTFAATFVRLRGGNYVVCQTPDQWMAMYRETM